MYAPLSELAVFAASLVAAIWLFASHQTVTLARPAGRAVAGGLAAIATAALIDVLRVLEPVTTLLPGALLTAMVWAEVLVFIVGMVLVARGVRQGTALFARLEEEVALRAQAETALASEKAMLLETREQADRASRAKSDFIAMVSHEIRNPMNGVLGMAEALGRTSLNPEQREMLSVIAGAGEAMRDVLNDVLDLSKIEAGRLTFETMVFSLAEVIQSVEIVHGANAQAKGLEFSVRMERGTPQWREGDPHRIGQILHNLCSNAVKFTEDGAVSVFIGRDVGRGPNIGILIEVRDTGIGIEDDLQKTLFTPFVQADESIRRRFGGTGLGLSIIKQIVEAMGGAVTVTSKQGQGSTFRVMLPLPVADAPALEAPVSAPPVAAAGGEAQRILAVDDNAMNQAVLKALLQPTGAQVEYVTSGQAAIEAFRRGAFDLVLMDIQMPGMNGVEATIRIRAIEDEEKRQPVALYALTASAMDHQVQDYLKHGFDGHIAKPIKPAELMAVVRGTVPRAA